MKKLLPQRKANATKGAKDIEKARNKQKKYLPQMDADKRRCSETQNVFICVYLRLSVDKNVCNFL